MLPASIDEVYEEGIPVCATLEMSDRYRFHYPQRPFLKRSDAKTPHSGGQSKRSSRDPGTGGARAFHPIDFEQACSDLVFTVHPKSHCSCHGQITPGAVLFDLIRSEDAFCF